MAHHSGGIFVTTPNRPLQPGGDRAPWVGGVAWVLWLLVGLQAAYWGWRLWGSAAVQLPALSPISVANVDPQRMARVLTQKSAMAVPEAAAAAAGTATVADWRVVGVIADRRGDGAAVLVREGVPARLYRVGTALPDGWRVVRVERAEVWLVPPGGGEAQRLTVPVPQVPASPKS